MTYIIRPGWPSPTYTILADELKVSFGEKFKEVRNFGFGREVAFDGWDHRRLCVRPTAPVRDTGNRAHSDTVQIKGLIAQKVRERLRVLAPDDVRELSRIDEQIADLEDKIVALRIKRAEQVKAAWRRAGTPNISDLIDEAKATAARREAAEANA